MEKEYVLPFTGIEIEEKLKEIEKLSENNELFSNTAVFCTEQSLTDEQKAIARANIGVSAEGDFNWNDLKDKPFDENGKLLNSVLPDGYPMKASVSKTLVSNKTVTEGYIETTSLGLEAGKAYTVIWDGIEYPDLIATENDYAQVFLKGSFPFEVIDCLEDGFCAVQTSDEENEHTITILTESSVTIIPMSEEYIPDTIARTEDIPEGFSGSWNDLTDRPEIPEVVTDEHINTLIDTKLTNTVKSINGTNPDENGNVEINIETVLDANGKLLDSVFPDGYPHGEPEEVEVLLSDYTVTDLCWIDAPTLKLGKTYTVILDGVEYSDLVAELFNETELDEETGEEVVLESYLKIYTDEFEIECHEDDTLFIELMNGKESAIMSVFTVLKPATLVPMSENFIPDTIARITSVPTDDHINALIDAKLGVIENGTY